MNISSVIPNMFASARRSLSETKNVSASAFGKTSVKPAAAPSCDTFESSKSGGKSSKNVSFGAIYLEDVCRLGKVSQGSLVPKLLERDALLLNKIAQAYPNQDCFIMKGYCDFPKLEFRERPPEVQIFTKTPLNSYVSSVDADDPSNPPVPLLLYGDNDLTEFIGVPSFISLNPSLSYTVKAGYDLHKKLLEKKIQIMEQAGQNDIADFGDETVLSLAHKAIEDVEVAVTRYLLECSYAALTDKAYASQIYASNYPEVQPKLSEERRLDLITSVEKQEEIKRTVYSNMKENDTVDICDIAMKNYPNIEENKERISLLLEYMRQNNHYLV